jgi:hypothetical protein
MPPKPKVAVLFTSSETVLQDYYAMLFDLAGRRSMLPAGTPTILKDNKYHLAISHAWRANTTTPRRLGGTILALRAAGINDLVCIQNQTVVTSAFKGEDLNGY